MRTPGTVREYQFDVLTGLFRQVTKTARGETLTVMFPRQAGKNEVSAMLVAMLLTRHHEPGGSVIVCAPSLHPQAQLSFERTVRLVRAQVRMNLPPPRLEGNTIRCGAASATFLSGMPEANVAGHTASIALIGDEAQDLDADWFNRQFKPMTASTGASTVLFGTPWQGGSLLEEAVERNRERDARFEGVTGKYRNGWDPFHHQVSWGRVAQENKAYGRFVRQERERLGATHPIFLSQYELVSVADEKRLLSPSLLWALEGAFGPLDAPVEGERYAGGLDFAGEGAKGDATVLTIGRVMDEACEVVHIESWRGASFDTVLSAVVAAARHWGLSRLVCDQTGIGAPLVAQLAKKLHGIVSPLPFTLKSKSQLGFELIADAEMGRLRIAPATSAHPAFGVLWDELRICLSEPHRDGTLRWGAPSGAHDDHVVSLALCLRASKSVKEPRIAVGRSR